MTSTTITVGISVGLLVVGLLGGYVIAEQTYSPKNTMMNDSGLQEQMMNMMMQNPQQMQQMIMDTMDDSDQMTMMEDMMEDMMQRMQTDPELEQAMMKHMANMKTSRDAMMSTDNTMMNGMMDNSEVMQDMMQNSQMMNMMSDMMGSNTIVMGMNMFMPNKLNIEPKTTITWETHDMETHNVVGIFKTDSGNEISILSGDIEHMESWNYIFEESGVFEYICGYHEGMKGEIVVS